MVKCHGIRILWVIVTLPVTFYATCLKSSLISSFKESAVMSLSVCRLFGQRFGRQICAVTRVKAGPFSRRHRGLTLTHALVWGCSVLCYDMTIARMWSSLSCTATFYKRPVRTCPGSLAEDLLETGRVYAFRVSILFGVSHRCLYSLLYVTQSLIIDQGIVTPIRPVATPCRSKLNFQR